MTKYTHCVTCGVELPTERLRRAAKTCSPHCMSAARKRKYAEQNPVVDGWASGLCAGKVGAIQEMLACADLLKRGISVFRAVSPQETCDLLALKDGLLKRVEVTTGFRTQTGRLNHSKSAHRHRFDLLMVVDKSGNIYYDPPLEALFKP